MRSWRDELDGFLADHADELVSVRRHLHAHPEASHEEFQTTRVLARWLQEAGLDYRILPTGRGVVAEPPGSTATRRVALRADIDALRIHDAKDTPYRSTRDGLMHACGHDAHTAMLLGAVRALAHLERTGALPHPVPWRALFQPSEESGDGALEMIEAGAMEGVACIVALHVDPDLPVGRVARRTGVMTACCDEFHAAVHGRGGHAARPHQTIDPIAAAVGFISAAYQLVPRAVDSRDPVVLTIGAITGGVLANVIPDRVVMRGTLRTLARTISRQMEDRLHAIARGIGEATGATIELTFQHGPDAVVNDVSITAVVSRAAGEVVGETNVGELPRPSLGGEDFAAYLAHAPGCLLRLGVAAPGSEVWPPLHAPNFDIDEQSLTLGARILARSAVLLAAVPG